MTSRLTRPRGFSKLFITSVSLFWLSALSAFSFTYNSMDLLFCMRQPLGSYELVVDLGPATNYDSLTAGTTLTITNYTMDTMTNAFSDLADCYWSVFGTQISVSVPTPPVYTCWRS